MVGVEGGNATISQVDERRATFQQSALRMCQFLTQFCGEALQAEGGISTNDSPGPNSLFASECARDSHIPSGAGRSCGV